MRAAIIFALSEMFQIDPDWICAYQNRLSPELKLVAEVLRDAIELIQHGPKSLAERDDAIKWVRSDRPGPFSFRFVCQALNLDPQAVRAAINEAWEHGGADFQSRFDKSTAQETAIRRKNLNYLPSFPLAVPKSLDISTTRASERG